MEYPSIKQHPHDLFTQYSSDFAGGFITHFNFTNGAYTYAVYYSLIGAGWPTMHEEASGVKVVHEGQIIADLRCRSAITAKLKDDSLHLFKDGGGYEYWLFDSSL
ncbi:MAG TPA: hypothetical protein VGE00_10020 [Gammaproteobacteria bacterium]